MRRALVVSVVLHGVFGAALFSFGLRTGDAVERTPITPITPITIDVIAPARETPPKDVAGGGSSLAVAGEAPAPAPNRSGRAKQPAARVESPNGTLAIERANGSTNSSSGGVDRNGDGGDGNGTGGNHGDGIGFGDGGRIVLDDQQFTLPPAPKADVPPPSKARPAKLIYPSRHKELGEDRLFVARITVDTDGYVVGARLVRGINGPGDDEAADLIFRFRYLPALDDTGRAIASTFEQPFHVNR